MDGQKTFNDLTYDEVLRKIISHRLQAHQTIEVSHFYDCATCGALEGRLRRLSRMEVGRSALPLKTKYPKITVQLTGMDGNAYVILGRVSKALELAGVPDEEIAAFRNEATAGDYDQLLQTCMKWVNAT